MENINNFIIIPNISILNNSDFTEKNKARHSFMYGKPFLRSHAWMASETNRRPNRTRI